MADEVVTYLAEVGERAGNAAAYHQAADCPDPWNSCTAHDALRAFAALGKVLDLAAELDIEDGYIPELGMRRPVSRGDRIRGAIRAELLGSAS